MSADTPRVPIYKDFVLIQLAVLIFLIDQFTKFLVRDLLLYRESFPATGFFRFTHTFNTGSAFGIFQDQNTPLILVSIIGIAILVMIYRSQRVPTGLLRLSLGLQIGGALGNLLDRMRLGHVTDFVDVGDWPVFNVADASIITGLVILAYIFLIAESDVKKDTGPTSGYGWCPVCEGEMRTVMDGWRCSTCGVKERLLDSTL
ncbi:MAG: signal peptidase II [SAR202 cluster bacterium Io17-Chloro-G6]|nr:MAG: signal peptidase II [SAR202 cluster bacterium Io17-Chloro-G6]